MTEKLKPEEIVEALRELLGRPDPVGFRRAGVAPPAPHFITQDDRLYIRSRNFATGVTLHITGRVLQPGGWPQEIVYDHVPNTDRSVSIESFSLGEGFILGLAVIVVAGTVRRGQCFVELGLLRGLAAAGSERQVFVKDYAVGGDVIGWPGGPLRSSLEGPGILRSIAGADPAANTEWSVPVPVNARWKLHGARVQLVTDANVANRRMHVLIDDGATAFFGSVAGGVQAASLTHNYNVGNHGIISAAVANEQFVPIPPAFPMLQAWRIRSSTDNLQATDNYGPPQLDVEEWLEE